MIYNDLFNLIVSPDNLFIAWERFAKDKRRKPDVMKFEFDLERNIFELHRELVSQKYKHGPYKSFYIRDPKVRHIHKATVRDRVVHHAVYQILMRVFEPTFISTSFSCRIGKGNHKGVKALGNMARKESKNYSTCCYALKCDIRKFFDSIEHGLLIKALRTKISDSKTLWLLEEIIGSFNSIPSTLFERRGVPIGNLTSQLFANVYLGSFDQFVKRALKIKRYARYTDDFIVLSRDREYLENLIPQLESFLSKKLLLDLHPEKVGIRKLSEGVDFLGYVTLPYYRTLRSKTRRRVWRKLRVRVRNYRDGSISKHSLKQSLNSYLGVLSHANAFDMSEDLKNQFWFWLTE